MNQFIRSLSASQQVGALFLVVFGLLGLATVVLVLLSLRERHRATDGEGRELRDLQRLLKTSWLMVVVFWVA
ncbi:MAG: phosphatidate cytidylyltransferase, partial [Curvibacter sp.]